MLVESVLRADIGMTAAQGGFPSGQLVHLFAEANGEAVFANTAIFSDAGTLAETSLRRRLHSHHLPSSEKPDQVAICAPRIQDQCKTLSHP